MRIPTANSRLRKVNLLLRKYRAILIFVGDSTRVTREKIERHLENLQKLQRREILSLLTKMDRVVGELSSRFGFRGKLGDLEKLIDAEPNIQGEAYLLLPKHFLQQLFSHYERAMPIFPKVPPHARIYIDVAGHRQDQGQMEFLLLEASLFEDMAILWNDVVETSEHLGRKDNKPASLIKRKNALMRATAKAAFDLVLSQKSSEV